MQSKVDELKIYGIEATLVEGNIFATFERKGYVIQVGMNAFEFENQVQAVDTIILEIAKRFEEFKN